MSAESAKRAPRALGPRCFGTVDLWRGSGGQSTTENVDQFRRRCWVSGTRKEGWVGWREAIHQGAHVTVAVRRSVGPCREGVRREVSAMLWVGHYPVNRLSRSSTSLPKSSTASHPMRNGSMTNSQTSCRLMDFTSTLQVVPCAYHHSRVAQGRQEEAPSYSRILATPRAKLTTDRDPFQSRERRAMTHQRG